MIERNEAQLLPGLADPVADAQAVFRVVMRALAQPGTSQPLPTPPPVPPALPAQLAAIALALADYETPLWCDPPLAEDDGTRRYLTFHTGARIADTPTDAAFALLSEPHLAPPLTAFAQGSLEFPDRSTTLVLAVRSLDRGNPLVFEGPGIRERASLAPEPAPPDLAHQLRENRARFPRGVDIIFATPSHVAALPRSAAIRS